MTIREYKGEFDNLKLTFVGDGNNMANSLIVGCLKVGMSVAIACPKTHLPDSGVLEFAKSYGDKFLITDDVLQACNDADVLLHGRLGVYGTRGRGAREKESLCRLSNQREDFGSRKERRNGTSLPARSQRRRNHRRGN